MERIGEADIGEREAGAIRVEDLPGPAAVVSLPPGGCNVPETHSTTVRDRYSLCDTLNKQAQARCDGRGLRVRD